MLIALLVLTIVAALFIMFGIRSSSCNSQMFFNSVWVKCFGYFDCYCENWKKQDFIRHKYSNSSVLCTKHENQKSGRLHRTKNCNQWLHFGPVTVFVINFAPQMLGIEASQLVVTRESIDVSLRSGFGPKWPLDWTLRLWLERRMCNLLILSIVRSEEYIMQICGKIIHLVGPAGQETRFNSLNVARKTRILFKPTSLRIKQVVQSTIAGINKLVCRIFPPLYNRCTTKKCITHNLLHCH